MSGFFSLEAGIRIGKVHKNHHHNHQDQDQQQQQHNNNGIISPYSLYLFKNNEIYGKSFELWQQNYQNYDNNNNNNNNNNSNSNNKGMRQGGYGGIGGGSSSSSAGGMNCQDCGNQAKKDCQHMRCRTCCKSRGLHCQTHVKSTWVPAAKRRERQQQLMSLAQQNSGNQQLSLVMRATTGSDNNNNNNQTSKRPREDHHNRSVILPSSGLEVGAFPAEVSSPAVFRCVRVSAMDEAEEQLAYQTAVSIGGHVFKGILYDHGPEGRYGHHSGEGSSSAGGGGGVHLQQLNLITSGTTAVVTEPAGITPAVAYIDPASTYPTPFSAFMAGTQFFPPPRS